MIDTEFSSNAKSSEFVLKAHEKEKKITKNFKRNLEDRKYIIEVEEKNIQGLNLADLLTYLLTYLLTRFLTFFITRC